jgi:hypothetical protein
MHECIHVVHVGSCKMWVTPPPPTQLIIILLPPSSIFHPPSSIRSILHPPSTLYTILPLPHLPHPQPPHLIQPFRPPWTPPSWTTALTGSRPWGTACSGATSPPPRVVAYVDGVCLDNGTPAARAGVGIDWGASVAPTSERLPGPQTTGRAALWVRVLVAKLRQSVIRAIELHPDRWVDLHLYSRSQYAINSASPTFPPADDSAQQPPLVRQ